MKEIKVNLKKSINNSYKIFIQTKIEKLLCQFIKKEKTARKYAIITDSKVKKLYGNPLLSYLKKQNIQVEIFDFPNGERSKNLNTIENLASRMIKAKFDRQDAIISLGGGVVGDISGFLASIYMRGVPYIQIATTLLSMVDSSVGGKTGVDLKSGKNLIGSFYQPKAVFINPDYLKTLPEKQIRNGLAEVIKYGVIKDNSLFNFIEQNIEKIFSLEEKSINKIIFDSIKIKAEIVEKDEHEKNERMILNYGHTYGHEIEKLSDYKLLHGYAISIGMVLANKIAVAKKILPKQDAERIKNLLKKAELPIVTMKKIEIKDISSDKKKQGNFINLILPQKIGKVVIHKEKCQ